MTYPDVRYLGEAGEVNAVFRPADVEAEVQRPSGDRTHFVATSRLTHGEFGLYKIDMAPRLAGTEHALPQDDLGVVLRAVR